MKERGRGRSEAGDRGPEWSEGEKVTAAAREPTAEEEVQRTCGSVCSSCLPARAQQAVGDCRKTQE